MGFRFRRSVRLAPGIRINLSKNGASLSLGRRGATLNFSGRGTKATVGLPGSGLSYSEMLQNGPPTALPREGPASGLAAAGWLTIGFLALAVILVALIGG
jgi:hypothetical protein